MREAPFAKLGFLSEAQKQKLFEYAELLKAENAKVNMVSRKDTDDLVYRHIAFCAAIGAFFTPDKGAEIVDVGTGGGLPGVVMAILWPQAKIEMLDGVGKKIACVNRMVEALGLKNAVAIQGRVEERKKLYDYAVGRSVCSLYEFVNFTKNAIAKGKHGTLENGVIYFKGGEWDEELKHKKLYSDKTLKLDEFFCDEQYAGKSLVHIPQSAIYGAFFKKTK